MDFITHILTESAWNLYTALKILIVPAVIFLMLARICKGKTWLADLRRALPETELNLKILAFNAICSFPVISITLTVFYEAMHTAGIALFSPAAWDSVPTVLVLFTAVFLGDFFNYWRHRLDHTPMLWPAHAVHHSDTEVTWLTAARWHPVNLLTMRGIGGTLMLFMGFPVYAILFNSMMRGYYGHFIHADLPWTYGKWGKYFVSPAMHRWHHSAEEKAFDKNFGEFFCIFDRAFGTFYLPGPCDGPLGVGDDMEPTLRSQIGYAFSPRAYKRLFSRTPVAGENAS